ncbi:HlyD family secretion protein [Pantoea stewartii]|uniref:HlyD family secretion protein n=1 Tax=Pantoea stewartii TaxID=66269 RepID=UPI002DB61779|nr:HlyD family secretion protein [Pantoea stewartii]MEB6533200.1 HlyD family secretion protein [Pantoea stewartii]
MRALVMRKTVLLSLLLLLVLLAMALIVWSVMTRNDHRTNDAWVNADYTLVAPKVSGYIASVRVKDNQQVAAGELLATLDDRDYKVALESAEAALQVSEAKLLSSKAQLEQQQSVIDEQKASVSASQASAQYAGQSAERYNRLYQRGTVAADEQQKASSAQRSASAAVRQSEAALASAIKQVGVLQAAVRSAEADVAAARASVDQARLNLSYTRIVAPVAGMVGQRAVRLGAYVSAGTRLLAVVPLQQTYITANYLETQLQDVRPGQPVRIRVDALPDQIFTGHVDSLAPATGATFAAIAPDNATGNYTKVVQRLPVKIVLDQNQKNLAQLRVGMSAVPDIDVR